MRRLCAGYVYLGFQSEASQAGSDISIGLQRSQGLKAQQEKRPRYDKARVQLAHPAEFHVRPLHAI
jgi:hypothetical protein